MSVSRTTLMSLGGLLVLAACAVPTPSEADLFETAVMGTVEALASLPPMTATPSPSQTPTPTPTSTLTPTATLTPTPLPPMASVLLATNCRTGPGSAYPFVLSLQPEQVVEVTAKSTVDNYWFVAIPDQADENCWLWGEYATVEGDVSTLPVLTPEPAPVPKIDFILYQHSFMRCGSLHVSFTVVNNSRTTFKTAKIHVQDLNYPDDIFGPAVDRHPFAPSPSVCPPGHSNFFPPGAAAYLVVPISPVRAGNDGLATIKLCTEDWGGGDCVTKTAYFKLPDD
ncbi:MAG: hypothetical protein BMS9Abin28_0044 [Anaerolineae bacterium]|nr:MAG: hypothetical protein BMS9Abin28_0044 [Anaerolineae bacterium]